MATELALKHKDSLVLKEDKLHSEKRKVRNYNFNEKKWEELSFPWLITSVFVFYWFILVPLIWLICHLTKHWPWLHWPFWTVAFVIWTAIICGAIVLWKRLEVKRNREATLKYGSNHKEGPYSNIRQITSENGELVEMKKMNNTSDDESKKNDRNLPPLMLDKRVSGENEDNGMKQDGKDEMAQGLDVADDCKDRPFQDNLKLVTVSSLEDEIKTPMSPRELFFIDLIREAEKAESAKSLKIKTHFFPDETTEDNAKDVKEDAQDATDVRSPEGAKDAKVDENGEKTSELKLKRKSSYFIADVESSAGEKTEVFLQVNSSVREEQRELSVEKSVLTLKSNEENSQETMSSQAR